MPPTTIYLILISSFFIPHPAASDESYISFLINQNGLDFIKNLLISKAINTFTPTRFPKSEKTVKIPVIGKVHMALSDITINRVNVGSSAVKPGQSGVSIVASDITSDLSMKWHYAYGTWVVPISVSDSGTASVKVNGMRTGVTLGLGNEKGSMKVSVKECNCVIGDINIDLHGGASWLYQGIVDAFEELIISEFEKAITTQLKNGVSQLESTLRTLPKQISVDDNASINVTFVDDPFISDDSIGFEINGLFVEPKSNMLSFHKDLHPPILCSDPSQMIGIALEEAVFNSAFALYYDAMFMHWIVDKVPEQSLLNTAGWRFIIPQLYKKYPNDNMNLNISLSAPPIVRISWQKIDAIVYADLVIDVLQGSDTIPVACIQLVIAGTGSVQTTGNNLTTHLNMEDFSMSLKWSNIGTLHMFLVQPVMWTLIETVLLPYANERLGLGFPLPIIQGFTLQNAEIMSSNSRITVCSNVSYEDPIDPSRTLVYDS